MRFVILCTAQALLFTLAAGCSPVPERARHTVEDYRADAGLRDEQLKLCANDPGSLGRTPDCINAKAAARQASTHSLRELPTVQLPAPSAPKSASRPAEAEPPVDRR